MVATKVRRGPKEKPQQEKKVPVKFWVKQKHFKAAKKDAEDLEGKYNSIQD